MLQWTGPFERLPSGVLAGNSRLRIAAPFAASVAVTYLSDPFRARSSPHTSDICLLMPLEDGVLTLGTHELVGGLGHEKDIQGDYLTPLDDQTSICHAAE